MSTLGVSWRQPLILDHPYLDLCLHGFCNSLGTKALISWREISTLRAFPLFICGLLWPYSPTARVVCNWIRRAAIGWCLCMSSWTDSWTLAHFGQDRFDCAAHGPWIHPMVPIVSVCAVNVVKLCLSGVYESYFIQWICGGMSFRRRTFLFLGSVLFINHFLLPACFRDFFYLQADKYNAEKRPGVWISDAIRRWILAPQVRRTSEQRRHLSTTFLGISFHSQPYIYSHLPSRNSIRLLQLSVDVQEGNRINANLVNFDISQTPSYEAISYRWGEPEKTHQILIGHQIPMSLGIARSVYDALCDITPLTGTKYIWIDSICINQSDQLDQLQQIPLMANIYDQASLVTAHIPYSGDGLLTNHFATCLTWFRLRYFSTPEEFYSIIRVDPEELPYGFAHPGWRSLTELVRNPIWTRAWIVQETILARKWRLLFGGSSIGSWTLFMANSMYDAWEEEEFNNSQPGEKSIQRFYAQRDASFEPLMLCMWQFERNGRQRLPLVDNIISFLVCEATQPRDRVFALLGISCESMDQWLQRAEYSTQQLYIQVVRQALEAGSFKTFSISGASYCPVMDLPSWLPDLSSPPKWRNTSFYHRDLYAAGTALQPEYAISLDGRELQIRAVLLDRIQASTSCLIATAAGVPFGSPVPSSAMGFVEAGVPRNAETWAQVLLLASDSARLVTQHISDLYLGVMHPLEAFCRTIMQDVDEESLEPPTELALLDSIRLLSAFLVEYITPLWEDEIQELPSLISKMEKMLENDDMGSLWHDPYSIITRLLYTNQFWQFAVTQEKYLALVPAGTKPGDVVCIFSGSPIPCVLRPADQKDRYFFWGEAYVQGVMEGEAMPRATHWLTIA